MPSKSLAVKYRPTTFDDVSEQTAIKIILCQQLETNTTKNAYLFCGGAGTGKTTCARIFANCLNNGDGAPIEMDAASHSSVDDVREIIHQAQTQSISSTYKIFIVDECHSLSSTAWQAFLKVLEEPPAKSIFIFCTTDPQKIPKTILSRVQRYDFQRISFKGIVSRLKYILQLEGYTNFEIPAIEYIAKLADGGMRDAITLMDKCLAYSQELTVKTVIEALGTTDFNTMFNLTDNFMAAKSADIIKTIEDIHLSGKDLKFFVKQYTSFILDLCKCNLTNSYAYISIPITYANRINVYPRNSAYVKFTKFLKVLNQLNADIKWETTPKPLIEATFILAVEELFK